ncbi:MAG: 50S ribosomal protein L13, partial [Candidatus Margulisbacteria bacterium]|nr:50S ribosomal protein L13 [Candidatus Margulisiibacteriota bacterium]
TNSESVKRDWYVIDAKDQILGRMATKIATYLRGKHKAIFAPHVDCGDFIVITNAEKIKVTGGKEKKKMYFSHSGYPGGDKLISYEKLMARDPAKLIRLAVSGMLPKNKLGRQIIKKLKIYTGDKHPHQAHKLQKLEV